MTATRIGKPLTECGFALQVNAERHLRTRLRLAQTYPPDLLAQTLEVADRCTFSLDELKYQYPDEVVPQGETRVELAAPRDLRRGRPALAARRAGDGRAADRARAGADHRAAVRALLPDRLRHRRASRARAASSARAAARRPTASSATAWASPRSTRRACRALRALHLARAQRAARHRRRLRARAARGGHPVPLRQVRPRPRRADRSRHQLPAQVGDPRRRQGARLRADGDRRAGGEPHLVGRHDGHPRAHRGGGLVDARPGGPAAGRADAHAHRLPAAPVAAPGRLRADAGAAVAHGADRERGDGRPHGHRVGQGRHRRARAC